MFLLNEKRQSIYSLTARVEVCILSKNVVFTYSREQLLHDKETFPPFSYKLKFVQNFI